MNIGIVLMIYRNIVHKKSFRSECLRIEVTPRGNVERARKSFAIVHPTLDVPRGVERKFADPFVTWRTLIIPTMVILSTGGYAVYVLLSHEISTTADTIYITFLLILVPRYSYTHIPSFAHTRATRRDNKLNEAVEEKDVILLRYVHAE